MYLSKPHGLVIFFKLCDEHFFKNHDRSDLWTTGFNTLKKEWSTAGWIHKTDSDHHQKMIIVPDIMRDQGSIFSFLLTITQSFP